MNAKKLLHRLLQIISVATLISGLVQMIHPALVLHLVSAEVTPATQQWFGTIGMFMALFGGMLLHVLFQRDLFATHPPSSVPSPVFLWAGLQKLFASVAVGIGVSHHLIGALALGIAGFDLLSGILILVFLRMLKQQGAA